MPEPGIVETATTALLRWVGGAGLSARQGPPSGDTKSDGKGAKPADVHVWLTALLPEQGMRPTTGLEPVRFRMRFLLATARADDVAALDRLLSATTTGPHRPVFDEVPAHVWQSSGVPARPAFYVDVPGRLDRPAPATPRVTAPLRIETVPLRPLSGVVLGPRDTPLAGMRVESADRTEVTYTGADGTFVLDGLPADRPARLRLSGRGLRFHHTVTADAASPAVIRCEIKEA
ncbi:carboxypeptidase-like regulatory domain-containing protein [Dactylosporangium sp. CA-152071]|uniref:carboxypeptidase-like regulatory domain-containing protein n=1 Tax=Dactylosporangium sp. CA-152071 TaxID=3239933 RepID=UPI003D8D7E81